MRSFSALAQAGVPAAGRSRVPAAGALMGLQNAPQGHWKSRARGGLWGNPKQALSRLFLLRLEIFPYSKKHFTCLFLAGFILS